MTARKVAKKARPDYTRNKSGCMVYTIECVISHDVTINDANSLQEAIDTLDQFGSAEIVAVDNVSETWDDACKILRQRMIQ